MKQQTHRLLADIDRTLSAGATGDILERVFPTGQSGHTPNVDYCNCYLDNPPPLIRSEYWVDEYKVVCKEEGARAALARSVVAHIPDNDQLETADGRIMVWNGREYELHARLLDPTALYAAADQRPLPPTPQTHEQHRRNTIVISAKGILLEVPSALAGGMIEHPAVRLATPEETATYNETGGQTLGDYLAAASFTLQEDTAE